MFDKAKVINARADLQQASKRWWNDHPMSYDWRSTNLAPEGSQEFFAEIDRRLFSASPFYAGEPPFAQLIPFAALRGKRVLEIGCGLGAHSQLLAENGCELTSIDITARAVELSKRRFALNGLFADIREMDAEQMEFAEAAFDFVWSWGVIHHSAHTDRIVREVARVLKPGGEFRGMVYNRHAFCSYMSIARGFISGKFLKGMSVDDVLSLYTDGYLARHYSRASLGKLLIDSGLVPKGIRVLGLTSELTPIPGSGMAGRLKYSLSKRIPDRLAARALQSVGSLLFATAEKRIVQSSKAINKSA